MGVKKGDGVGAIKALNERYDSQRVTAKFALLRRLMGEKCQDEASAEDWINEKLRAARKLSSMGVTIEEVALLGIVDNLPPKMKGLADMMLAKGDVDLKEAKRLVLEKQDAVQRVEVDTARLLATNVPEATKCMWCGTKGHWAADCTRRKASVSEEKGVRGVKGRKQCFECNEFGHIAWACPRKWKKGKERRRTWRNYWRLQWTPTLNEVGRRLRYPQH